MVLIERLGETSWPVLRELRRAALLDAPDAFWASWKDENLYDADEWIGFIRNVAWFIAYRDGAPVGLVGCLRRPECPDEPELIGMWVGPDERGSGIADALLGAAQRWVSDQGLHRVSLWITDGNDRARHFYERHFFRLTGERASLPAGRAGEEQRMRREWPA